MKTTELTDVIRGLSLETEEKPYIFDYQREDFGWSVKSEKEYIETEKEINKIFYPGENWEIYGWCDGSGYNYWAIQQEEPNYISITIKVNTEELTQDEVDEIADALDNATADADAIQYAHPPQYPNY